MFNDLNWPFGLLNLRYKCKAHEICVSRSNIASPIYMRRDQLTMGYFDNLDNETLDIYKKTLKNEKKKFIDVLFYL
jgi:hypothetical protein